MRRRRGVKKQTPPKKPPGLSIHFSPLALLISLGTPDLVMKGSKTLLEQFQACQMSAATPHPVCPPTPQVEIFLVRATPGEGAELTQLSHFRKVVTPSIHSLLGGPPARRVCCHSRHRRNASHSFPPFFYRRQWGEDVSPHLPLAPEASLKSLSASPLVRGEEICCPVQAGSHETTATASLHRASTDT